MQNFRTIATAGLIGFERFKSACVFRVLSDRLFWSFLTDFDAFPPLFLKNMGESVIFSTYKILYLSISCACVEKYGSTGKLVQ